MADIFAPKQAAAKDGGAWWRAEQQMPGTTAWWRPPSDQAPRSDDGFSFETGLESALTDYERASMRLRAVGIDPAEIESRSDEPWFMGGIQKLTSLGVGLDYLFGDAPTRMLLGGVTGLVKGEGFSKFIMQGNEVDQWGEQEDYSNLLGKPGADWHAPTGKELLLMWGMDQSQDRKGKIDVIDALGLALEVIASPAAWFSAGQSAATKAGVKGGTVAIRSMADDILDELADGLRKLPLDEIAESFVSKAGETTTKTHIMSLIERVVSPIRSADDIARGAAPDFVKMADRISAFDELEKYGLLDNLRLGRGADALQEFHVARTGLLPSAEELSFIAGGEYGDEMKRVMKSLGEATGDFYKANDEFRELARRTAEVKFGDYGGLKFGLPFHQLSTTGGLSASVLTGRQVESMLGSIGVDRKVVEALKRSIPGRAFARTFVSDWRLKQLESVDPGLASSLITLKRMATYRADNELHVSIDALIEALKPMKKAQRIDLLRIVEYPGEVSAELRRIVDDSGLTAFRKMAETLMPDDPQLLQEAMSARSVRALRDTLTDVRETFDDDTAALLERALVEAQGSDGARFAYSFWEEYDRMQDAMKGVMRKRAAAELGIDVPARYVDDATTGKKVTNAEWTRVEAVRQRMELDSPDAIAAFLEAADKPTLTKWHESVGKMLDAHAQYALYRVPGPLDLSNATREDAMRALQVFSRQADGLNPHEVAELSEALITEIALMRRQYEDSVTKMSALIIEEFGPGAESLSEVIESFRTGDYMRLSAAGATADAATTQSASRYYQLAHAMQSVGLDLQDLDRRINASVFELMSLNEMAYSRGAGRSARRQARAVLRQKLHASRTLAEQGVPVGTKRVAGGMDDLEPLIARTAGLQEIDSIADPETFAFYAARNGAVDDAERIWGPEVGARRTEIEDDVERLLDTEDALIFNGRSQTRGIFHVATEDPGSLAAMPVLTGDIGELGIPAVKLFADPTTAGKTTARVTVNITSVAFTSAEEAAKITGPASRIAVTGADGVTRRLRMVDLPDHGFNALYVRGGGGQAAVIHVLPEPDDFHSAMRGVYEQWGEGAVPQGALRTSIEPSRRPIITTFKDKAGVRQTYTFAGEEASALRRGDPRKLRERVKARLAEQHGIESSTRVRIEDADAYVGRVRVLEFDPEQVRDYGRGVERIRDIAQHDPAALERAMIVATDDMIEDPLELVASIGESQRLRQEAYYAGIEWAQTGIPVDERGIFHVTTAGDVLMREPILTGQEVSAKLGKQTAGLGASTGSTISATTSPVHAELIRERLGDAIRAAKATVSGDAAERRGIVDMLLDKYGDALLTQGSGYQVVPLNIDRLVTLGADMPEEELWKLAHELYDYDPYRFMVDLDVIQDQPVIFAAVPQELAHLDPDNVRVFRVAVSPEGVVGFGPDVTEVRTGAGGMRVTLDNFRDFEFSPTEHTAYREALLEMQGEEGVLPAEEFANLDILYDPERRVGIAMKKVAEERPGRPGRTVLRQAEQEVTDVGGEILTPETLPEIAQKRRKGGIDFEVTLPDGSTDVVYRVSKLDDIVSVHLPDGAVGHPESYEKAVQLIGYHYKQHGAGILANRHPEVFAPPGRVRTVVSDVMQTIEEIADRPARYQLMYPVNDSGYTGLGLHAMVQAIAPRMREGSEISLRLPIEAVDMSRYLYRLGFVETKRFKRSIVMTLDPEGWADFLARNPKALTRGIIEDFVDGTGIEMIRYATPLDELDPATRRAVDASIRLGIQATEADHRLYRAFKSAQFDEISKEWADAAGLGSWDTFDAQAQQAVRDLFAGDSPYDVLTRFDTQTAARIQEWADTARVMSDSLNVDRLGKELAPAGLTTKGLEETYQSARAYAEGVDVLSSDFLMASPEYRTIEAVAYQFTPHDIPEPDRRARAKLIALTDHYYRESELRGIAKEGGQELFAERHAVHVFDLGDGREVPIGPAVAREAVDLFNERLGMPGEWTRIAKTYGLSTEDVGQYMMRAWQTSKRFFESLDDFAGMTDERRLVALQKFIAEHMGLDPTVTRHLNPLDFLVPAYEYAPHVHVDMSDIPWWRRMVGMFEDMGNEGSVNAEVFMRPISSKMENMQIRRRFSAAAHAVNELVGHELFQADPAKAYAIYIKRAVKAITNYDMLETIAQLTDSRGVRVVRAATYDAVSDEWSAPAGYKVFTRLPDYDRLGRDPERMARLWPDLADDLTAMQAQHGQVRLMARAEIVDELELAQRHFFGDEQFTENLRLFDQIQGVWKTYATVLRPGFHMRNAFSNVWLNLYAGVKNPRHYTQALDIQMIGRQVDAFMVDALSMDSPRLFSSTIEAYDYMVSTGKLQARSMRIGATDMSLGEVYSLMKDHGIIGTGRVGSDIHVFTEQQLMKLRPVNRALNPFSSAWVPTQAGRQVGTLIENNARGAHFLAMLEATGDPGAAAWSVRKYLFDYSELTATEANVFKRLMPFYSWLRKNSELTADMLMHRPFLITSGVKTMQKMNSIDLTEYRPEWTEELGAFALPGVKMGDLNRIFNKASFGLLQLPEDATDPVSIMVGVPFLDMLNYNGRDLISALSPVIRAPIEIVTNYNTYYGKPISDFPGDLAKAPTSLIGMDEMVRSFASPHVQVAWDEMLQSWHVGRNDMTGDLMTDATFTYIWRQVSPHLEAWGKSLPNNDPDFLADFITFWTGVKLIPIDEAQAAYYTERDRAERLDNAIRAAKQRGADVPTWSELAPATTEEDGAWWR